MEPLRNPAKRPTNIAGFDEVSEGDSGMHILGPVTGSVPFPDAP